MMYNYEIKLELSSISLQHITTERFTATSIHKTAHFIPSLLECMRRDGYRPNDKWDKVKFDKDIDVLLNLTNDVTELIVDALFKRNDVHIRIVTSTHIMDITIRAMDRTDIEDGINAWYYLNSSELYVYVFDSQLQKYLPGELEQ